jgi:hypothetical protein
MKARLARECCTIIPYSGDTGHAATAKGGTLLHTCSNTTKRRPSMLYARLLGVLRSSAVARQHPEDTSNSPNAPSAP